MLGECPRQWSQSRVEEVSPESAFGSGFDERSWIGLVAASAGIGATCVTFCLGFSAEFNYDLY